MSRLDGVEVVFRSAVQAVQRGTDEAQLREWLYGLDAAKVRALLTLEELAV